MSTTAILCIARNETPYTEEWLEYHFHIGIDRVYYVSTDSDFARIQSFFEKSRFRSQVELLHFDDFQHGWQMRCYNAHFPLIEEDWVLVIDIDEFLYLNSFPNIGEYLKAFGNEIGQIQFPWLILMSNNYYEHKVFDIQGQSRKYQSDHVKSIVRRDCCNFVGIHSHDIGSLRNCLSSGREIEAAPKHSSFLSEPEYPEQHPFVLHFASRGHLDMMNRILGHKFFNSNNGQGERDRLCRYLTGPASWSNIPTRYLLMKFLATLPTVEIECNLSVIASRTNVGDLTSIFLKNINKIIDFEDLEGAQLVMQFEDRFQFAEKMRLQDVSGNSSLDEYLDCGSQLEYIGKLRDSLLNIKAG